MAPKRSSPLDDPPSASSTSSTSSSGAESEEINDRKEQEQNKRVAESEEEEEESSGDEEEEEAENKTPPPVQTPTPTATPQPQSSSGSEGSDSEEDSRGTQTSPTASDFAIKPIISKPMDDSTKHKKPTLKSPKSGAKRPAESEEKRKESQQKKKRKVAANGDEKDGVLEEKKSAINRWSEDDEIVVLKGMIDFQKKKGPISHADMGAFLEFIKKSLHGDVSKNQLVEKVRRLKKKYWSGAVKGEEPVFSKPHDFKCLELAKKIWGGGGSSNAFVEGVKSNSRKARKSVKVENSPKEEEQQFELQNGLNGEVKEELNGEVKDIKVEQEDFCYMYPNLQKSLGSEGYASLSEDGRNFIKGSLSLIGSVKAKELEEKWKKFRVAEVTLFLQQIELIQEQTKLIFEAMKSLNS